ncbi:helix-turn-helix domain-containing protein [Morganella morganii]|uniref:helix-turn-helix domain-containing protein n=1 Tax=Morganella morganii TaxID=582 RepID=UPI00069A722B|nr:helix-turn-helix transcriptional regulator [Morganella morganii]MDI9764698.1 helix-turn-helix domain-containing protein [Morganella morganii]
MSINLFNSNTCLHFNTHGYKFAYMKSTLAERLKEAMKIRGDMTQASLAEASGVAQPTIWRLVNGKAKGSVKLVDIANALAVNIDWLANGNGEMDSPNKELPYQIDKSLNIAVWNENGQTEEFVISPLGKPLPSYRAYIISRNTGCADVTSGSIAITDYGISPGTGDLVIAKVGGNISAYKFLDGGEHGFLSVDDSRVPLIALSDAELLGVIVFLIRDFRR